MTTSFTGDEGQATPADYETVDVNGTWMVRMRWDSTRDPAHGTPMVGEHTCRTAAMEQTTGGTPIFNLRDCDPDRPATAPADCGRIIEEHGQLSANARQSSQCLLDALTNRRPARLLHRRITIEGDPIAHEYQTAETNGTWVIRMRFDMSADRYAPTPSRGTHVCTRAALDERGAIAPDDCH